MLEITVFTIPGHFWQWRWGSQSIVVVVLLFMLGGCSTRATPTPVVVAEQETENKPNAVSASFNQAPLPADGIMGDVIYVPAYSHIFFRDESRTIELAVTLTLHNTDPAQSICITNVEFYGSEGQLLRSYLDEPRKLAPFASIGYVVRDSDTEGGLGANFLVEWLASTEVNPPIAEAVMISTASSQGISFISPGRVLPKTEPSQTGALLAQCFGE